MLFTLPHCSLSNCRRLMHIFTFQRDCIPKFHFLIWAALYQNSAPFTEISLGNILFQSIVSNCLHWPLESARCKGAGNCGLVWLKQIVCEKILTFWRISMSDGISFKSCFPASFKKLKHLYHTMVAFSSDNLFERIFWALRLVNSYPISTLSKEGTSSKFTFGSISSGFKIYKMDFVDWLISRAVDLTSVWNCFLKFVQYWS